MSETEGAYWAGFIDAEGTIGLGKRNNPSHTLGFCYLPYISVSNTNIEILRELKSKFGGHISTNKPTFTNGKDVHRWWIDSKGMREFLAVIHPYLKMKKKQADIISHYVELRSKYFKGYVPKVFWEIAETAYQEMKVLNRRGKHET